MKLSAHLSFAELACWNRLGREWKQWAPGAMVETYPLEWSADRAVRLAANFEEIRHALGDLPIRINSGYRTPAYNAAVGGAKLSQHVQGRAIDIRHATLKPYDLFAKIRRMEKDGALPLLGGIGLYATFVHIDVRPRQANGRLAIWFGKGMETKGGIG